MTFKQKILKAVYPLFLPVSKLFKKNTRMLTNNQTAPVSFYTLKSTAINGQDFDFASLEGKKVLLVNTASDCGYTNQYEGLEKLYKQYNDKLVVIGFPANDFKEQEKGDDAAIEDFCKVNYGVTFPLMSKSTVIGSGQHPVFQWLTDKNKNGWNTQAPTWNFSKYLVEADGQLSHYFGPSVEPLSKELTDAINA
jgi:glutathione peroxidase